MFIVKPFIKAPSVRSALGFMSLTSRWGSIMFPGITVLTRDLNDILALHQLIQAKKKNNKFEFSKFKSKDTDNEVADTLVRILKKGNRKKFLQTMSYWQRYGSILSYFDFFNSQCEFSDIKNLRKIIFDNNFRPKNKYPNDFYSEVKKKARNIRIENADWYRDFRVKLHEESQTFSAQVLTKEFLRQRPLFSWWITGLNAPKDAPEIIVLSRKLEFALTVWQTAIETGTLLIKANKKIPSSGRVNKNSITDFYKNLAIYLNDPASIDENLLESIVQAALDVHETYFRDGSFDKWKGKLEKWLKINFEGKSINRYIEFHNRTSVPELASISSQDLLEKLAEIHSYYCTLQKKEDSIYVRSFKKRKTGSKMPSISASLSPGRWGLFGYRLEASVVLYQSQKYQDL